MTLAASEASLQQQFQRLDRLREAIGQAVVGQQAVVDDLILVVLGLGKLFFDGFRCLW